MHSDYGFWSRRLHRLALAHPAIAEAAFDVERALNRAEEGSTPGDCRPVFVTGLARSGTTILMRAIHGAGDFRSLTYRDMPFVLAPNLWGRISGLSRRAMAPEERAHGDAILVDFDSPEALEEVFWRVACGPDYIRPDRLLPMEAGPEAEADFRAYVALLLRRRPGARYLSKNNNNVLRLPSLLRCFPEASVVIPFREPLQQAASLFRQHRRFLARQAGDRFGRDYMTWLAHHEFGQDHRPFVFDAPPAGRPDSELGYWLGLWIAVYGFLVKTAPEGCLFVSYERLCAGDGRVWRTLGTALDLPPGPPTEPLRLARRDIGSEVPAVMVEEAEALHRRLLARAL